MQNTLWFSRDRAWTVRTKFQLPVPACPQLPPVFEPRSREFSLHEFTKHETYITLISLKGFWKIWRLVDWSACLRGMWCRSQHGHICLLHHMAGDWSLRRDDELMTYEGETPRGWTGGDCRNTLCKICSGQPITWILSLNKTERFVTGFPWTLYLHLYWSVNNILRFLGVSTYMQQTVQ